MTPSDELHEIDARRRWLAAGAAWPALAWTVALRAQTKPPVVIGWLSTGTDVTGRAGRATFSEGMAALGWKLDLQYVFEARAADGRAERLPALAQEIAAKKPAVIVAFSSAAAGAATAAAPTTPVVLVIGDPLAMGLVASLARPEGMITGLSNVQMDTGLKTIELLLEALPKLRRVGFLVDATSPRRDTRVNEFRRAAERLRFDAVIVDMAKPGDLPIEQPTTFEMILNMKTAKLLGITIPPSIRLRATEVIE